MFLSSVVQMQVLYLCSVTRDSKVSFLDFVFGKQLLLFGEDEMYLMSRLSLKLLTTQTICPDFSFTLFYFRARTLKFNQCHVLVHFAWWNNSLLISNGDALWDTCVTDEQCFTGPQGRCNDWHLRDGRTAVRWSERRSIDVSSPRKNK